MADKSSMKEESKDNSAAKKTSAESEQQPLREFTGTMDQGMAIMMAMTILQVLVSCIFVFWTREELIFPDRVAPKFIFDICRAMLTLGFAAFWM